MPVQDVPVRLPATLPALLVAAAVALGSGPCYCGVEDDCKLARESVCSAERYCHLGDHPAGGDVTSCLTRKPNGEPCLGPDDLLACAREGEVFQQHCALEQREQCAEGTTCRILTGTEDERYCSSGLANSPCVEDADCDGQPGLLCGLTDDEHAVRRCMEPHYLEPGAACERTQECPLGTVCWSPASLCREPPTCEAPGALKQRCCEDEQCASELTCLTFEPEPFCWRPHEGEQGESCSLDRHCIEGLACVQGDARHSACAAPGAEGAACEDDLHCADGLACVQGEGRQATCAPPGDEGTACEEDRHCQQDLRCVALDPGRCSSGALGAPCADNWDCQGEWVCDQHEWVCFER